MTGEKLYIHDFAKVSYDWYQPRLFDLYTLSPSPTQICSMLSHQELLQRARQDPMHMTRQMPRVKPEILRLRNTPVTRIVGQNIRLVVRGTIPRRVLDPVLPGLLQDPAQHAVCVEQHHVRVWVRAPERVGVVCDRGVVPSHHGRVRVRRRAGDVARGAVEGWQGEEDEVAVADRVKLLHGGVFGVLDGVVEVREGGEVRFRDVVLVGVTDIVDAWRSPEMR